MTRFLIVIGLLLGGAALAGGVVHLVQVDEAGEIAFAPRIDAAALDWWVARAQAVAAQGSTLDEAIGPDAR